MSLDDWSSIPCLDDGPGAAPTRRCEDAAKDDQCQSARFAGEYLYLACSHRDGPDVPGVQEEAAREDRALRTVGFHDISVVCE